jgi:hypothetical protein
LSGTLALELWAKPEAHSGGAAINGEPLARVMLGQLAGQGVLEHVEGHADFTPPPMGEWRIVLALAEWTQAAGFVVRDFCNFSVPVRNAAAAPEQPAEATPAPRRPPSHEEIAVAAYYRFLARGDQAGNAEEDWLAAERKPTQL